MQPHSDPLFGRYTVVAPLGRHATGTSSLVDGPDGRQVLTVLPVADGAAFLRDAAVAARPSGPGAAPVLAYGFDDGVAWFVSPDPSGRDLADVPVSDVPVAAIVGRAFAALDAARASATGPASVPARPAPAPARRAWRRWPVIAAAVVAVLVLVGAVVGVTVMRSGSSGPAGPVTAIAGGGGTVCVIADRELYCLGRTLGESSAHNATFSPMPTVVPGLDDVTSVSMGVGVVCAVAGGEVYCWGSDAAALTGDTTSFGRALSAPVKVPGLSRATTVTASRSYRLGSGACAVTSSGTYCWGFGTGGYTLTKVRGPGEVRAIEMNFYEYSADACMLATGGAVSCWSGGTNFDMVGKAPQTVTGLPPVTRLSVSGVCGVADDRAYCWEQSDAGPILGRVLPGGLADVADVAVDRVYRDKCVVSGGSVYCTTKLDEAPQRVDRLDHATAVTTKTATCAVADGYLYCWGDLSWRTGADSAANAPKSAPVRIDLAP
ncbi:RCC1 domain-containing protein [Tsukamurella pseudospumae]|uniref:Uncharacterized protein n=1 Tax=Tsukamurella pseudospumae TaxID=239498 RepID=A0A138AX00_9ACTN|nr:hypothetical protein [Tsukamurella pseudospumae]KXP14975.1 hypothetical protein AXK60_03685 [Tsukamurella pseudospumae]